MNTSRESLAAAALASKPSPARPSPPPPRSPPAFSFDRLDGAPSPLASTARGSSAPSGSPLASPRAAPEQQHGALSPGAPPGAAAAAPADAGAVAPLAHLPGAAAGLVIGTPAARRAAVLDTVRAQVRGHADAFYVVDLPELAHKLNEWHAALPRVRPFYAVKCNDDPAVVRTLAALGTGFDCATRAEIAMVLAAGVPPADVIFAHPAKQPSHIAYARAAGVAKMTFDNEEELRKIARAYPGARAVLRILTDDSASVCRLGLKFGAPLGDVAHLLRVAREVGVDVVGVSYHVGSGNGDAASFAGAVRDARTAFDIAASMGVTLTLLDIGGGFPGSDHGADMLRGVESVVVKTALPPPGAEGGAAEGAGPAPAANPYASAPSFKVIAAGVRAALDEHFPPGCGVELIAEPGRFFVKSTHALAVNVVGKRLTADEGGAPGGTRYNYYVNDGLYGSFNCIMYDHAVMSPDRLLPAAGTARAELDLNALAAAHAAAAARAAPSPLARLGPDAFAADAEAADADAARGAALGHAAGGGGGGGSGYARAALGQLSRPGGGALAHAHARALHVDAHAAEGGAGALPAVHPTTLWGPTCDSIDKICDAVPLPELALGDWLVFENAGAYTIAGSCKFNGFPLSTKVYIHLDGRVEVQAEDAVELPPAAGAGGA